MVVVVMVVVGGWGLGGSWQEAMVQSLGEKMLIRCVPLCSLALRTVLDTEWEDSM